MIFKVLSNHGLFRSQLFKNESQYTLWIVENESSIYTISFLNVLATDLYTLESGQVSAIMLLRDDEDDDFNVEIGKFNSTGDANEFLKWMKSELQ